MHIIGYVTSTPVTQIAHHDVEGVKSEHCHPTAQEGNDQAGFTFAMKVIIQIAYFTKIVIETKPWNINNNNNKIIAASFNHCISISQVFY
ncbi:hypothetical protein E2C01_078668 [Portunus trituberculatus]|uniref:Uncharacterized protein n=1 Tax=Portunus trituberculatus TaxID=210409 RepID=A0A5B7IND8_PORTR|nr:hypothetical protein [Portunus trituberculatus]